MKVQYSYAEAMIQAQSTRLGLAPPSVYYGIGDNPHADVRGANNAGEHWRSILVCTGVFQGTPLQNDEVDMADKVAFDVFEAVKHILEVHRS